MNKLSYIVFFSALLMSQNSTSHAANAFLDEIRNFKFKNAEALNNNDAPQQQKENLKEAKNSLLDAIKNGKKLNHVDLNDNKFDPHLGRVLENADQNGQKNRYRPGMFEGIPVQPNAERILPKKTPEEIRAALNKKKTSNNGNFLEQIQKGQNNLQKAEVAIEKPSVNAVKLDEFRQNLKKVGMPVEKYGIELGRVAEDALIIDAANQEINIIHNIEVAEILEEEILARQIQQEYDDEKLAYELQEQFDAEYAASLQQEYDDEALAYELQMKFDAEYAGL
jgi:hypothetical protein